MPNITMRSQNGNSCAAHCSVVSVREISNLALDANFAERDLWPTIQFVDQGGATTALAADKNSDPRRVVTEINRRWPKTQAKLLCDGVQKTTAMTYVAEPMRQGMDALFKLLTKDAASAPMQLDEGVFYNCSFTMHNGGVPTHANFSGMHNMLVTYEGGKSYLYNSNENVPSWTFTNNWKVLEGQNDGNNSYVFSGVSVAIF